MYVPCAGQSPNLVGVKAEGCCLEIVKFLDFVQRLYSFYLGFYASMKCAYTSVLGNYQVMVKRLADMRWSAHFNAVYALREGFANIQHALDYVSVGTDQEVNTRREAEGLRKRMENL